VTLGDCFKFGIECRKHVIQDGFLVLVDVSGHIKLCVVFPAGVADDTRIPLFNLNIGALDDTEQLHRKTLLDSIHGKVEAGHSSKRLDDQMDVGKGVSFRVS